MPQKNLSPPVEFVATHIKRQLPIPIHILRKSIDNVLTNIPQKKMVTTIAKKIGNKLKYFTFCCRMCDRFLKHKKTIRNLKQQAVIKKLPVSLFAA